MTKIPRYVPLRLSQDLFGKVSGLKGLGCEQKVYLIYLRGRMAPEPVWHVAELHTHKYPYGYVVNRLKAMEKRGLLTLGYEGKQGGMTVVLTPLGNQVANSLWKVKKEEAKKQ